MSDLNDKDKEALGAILDYEERTVPERDWPLGWDWAHVRVWPATLNRLLQIGLLEVVFQSHSYRGLRLTPRGREIALALTMAGETEAEEAEASREGPPALPPDLFSDIVGHEEVKELLRAALQAPRPVHVLLAGPPALAKSLFLWDLERAVGGERALWALGSASSKAGLVEALLEQRPWLLLVDEIEKLDARDQAAFLSVMEGGRLRVAKVGREADVALGLRVVAACNRLERLAPELVSRFAVRRLLPYALEEHRRVVVGVLTRREGLEQAVAEQVAALLEGRSQDVRDAVRVARLSARLPVERAVELLFPRG